MVPTVITTPVLVLIGPTAIGKTDLSFKLAERCDCEIISMDSMQVYRHMDIGTAKPSPAEQNRIVHHLIDIVDPDEQFNAARFVTEALQAIQAITARGKNPLLTGGTGLYLKALLEGLFDFAGTGENDRVRRELILLLQEKGSTHLFNRLREIDPETAARIHPNDTQRLIRALEIYRLTGRPWSQLMQKQPSPPVRFERILQIGLGCDRQELYERIAQRTQQMLEQGFIREVENLRKMGYRAELPSMQSIGYRHINAYIDGRWDMEETVRLLVRDTRRYAKRQMTWFGKAPAIRWFERDQGDEVLRLTENWLNDDGE